MEIPLGSSTSSLEQHIQRLDTAAAYLSSLGVSKNPIDIHPSVVPAVESSRLYWDARTVASRYMGQLSFMMPLADPTAQLLLEQAQNHHTEIAEKEASIAEEHAKATHDPLTGSLNRAGLMEALAEAKPTDTVLFIDLNNFKAVNDRHARGHVRGDEVLKDAATVLWDLVRPQDKVGRLGGDEFMIIFDSESQGNRARTGTTSPEEQRNNITARFKDNFKTYLDINPDIKQLNVDAAIGSLPRGTEDIETLMLMLDQKMQAHKAAQHKELGQHRPDYFEGIDPSQLSLFKID